jgi:vitamin B12 transporter
MPGVSGLRLHGHVGTGFRAPSLYELFGASMFGEFLYEFGNPDLKPEESLGWDAGVELKTFEEALKVDLTYFRNTFDKIIGFGMAGYENVDGGESQGAEFQAQYSLSDALTLAGSYTYTTTEDANGDAFYGVPQHEFGGSVTYQFLQKLSANLAVTLRGEEDIPLYDAAMMQSQRYTNDGFTKVDAGLQYAATKNINLSARIENLLDADYTVGGYTAPGRSFFGGIKVSF